MQAVLKPPPGTMLVATVFEVWVVVVRYIQNTVRSTHRDSTRTQYTGHSPQDTVHRTQYTVHSTQYTVHNTQYTVHSTQYTVHSAVRLIQSIQQQDTGPNMYPYQPSMQLDAPNLTKLVQHTVIITDRWLPSQVSAVNIVLVTRNQHQPRSYTALEG
jgi:hypothetical protein